jgi:hypothetical protein
MTARTSEEFTKIGTAEELEIASLRSDDTLRKSVTIWVGCLGDDLYIRSVNGRAAWFRGTQVRHMGHIRAGGVDKEVTFVDVDTDSDINTQVNAAYRTKYRRYAASILDHITSPDARAATIKLEPVLKAS